MSDGSGQKYDLVVVGGGSAGSIVAKIAAKKGFRTALLEKDKLGGTCLNYGCDPTKTMLHTAQLRYDVANAGDCGLQTGEPGLCWETLQERVRNLIARIRGGTHEDAVERQRARGIDVRLGEGSFVSPDSIEADGHTLRSDRFVIAAGCAPVVPGIPGLREAGYITNREAVYLDEPPARLAVIGAGPVGVEFAQMFRRFGSQVTLLEQMPHILPADDAELADALADALREEGVRVECGAEVERVTRDGKVKHVAWRREGEEQNMEVDEVLVAAGRRPDTGNMNLEAAGVAQKNGYIEVDENLRTSASHIWAAGDITGTPPFTHVAAAQAPVAAHNAFAEEDDLRRFNDHALPWCTFSDPALAHVGATQEDLAALEAPQETLRIGMDEVPRNLMTGHTKGLLKLTINSDTGALLAADVLARGAGEMVAPIAVAMRNGLTAGQVAGTILPYPTQGQAVVFAAKRA